MFQPIDGYAIMKGVLTFEGFKEVSKRAKVHWLLIYPIVLVMFLYLRVNNFFFDRIELRKKKKEKTEKSDA